MRSAFAACGGDDDDIDSSATERRPSCGNLIETNPDNSEVKLTVGSKNFTEQNILGEIYAQALEAAGYDVKTDLNLGSEQIALKALKNGEISGYPEYTCTALTSFFDVAPEDVPATPSRPTSEAKSDFAKEGLVAFPPTPFTSANAVGHAEEEGRQARGHDDLRPRGQVAGPDPLRLARVPPADRLPAGLEKATASKFKKFTPVDIGLRYEVLDKGQADLSILFTTDAQLFDASDKYVTARGRQGRVPGRQRDLRRPTGRRPTRPGPTSGRRSRRSRRASRSR